jgi:hypothetical protein
MSVDCEIGGRMCKKCTTIKPIELFYKKPDGRFKLSSMCKACDKLKGKAYRATPDGISSLRSRKARYRAKKLKATPPWIDLKAIRLFYSKCPKGYHVDHIVPLQGKYVSGLHTLHNLQYLTQRENQSKGNKHESDR